MKRKQYNKLYYNAELVSIRSDKGKYDEIYQYDQNKYTSAVHESAHAVISEILYLPITSVQIKILDDYCGIVLHYLPYYNMFKKIYKENEMIYSGFLLDYARSTLAGCVATAKINNNIFLYEILFNGGIDDVKHIYFLNDGEIKFLIKITEDIINEKNVWKCILNTARKLYRKNTLDRSEIDSLIKNNIPDLKLIREKYILVEPSNHHECMDILRGVPV